jgi:hypothetical protein
MSETPHFLKDLEVREMQSLDHIQLATSILEGVRLSSTPCRLALFGPWGSGKSTILKLVQNHIEADNEDEVAESYTRTFWFNAWEYESNANLFLSLMALLVEDLPDGVRYSRRGSKVVRRVLEAAHVHGRRWAVDLGDGGWTASISRSAGVDQAGAFEVRGVEEIRSNVERFVDMLLVVGGKGKDKRLVVFVDDVDKCLPRNALALLESIKLYFGGQTPIVFVCSIDADVLGQMVRAKYAHSEAFFAESYTEKIFEFNYQVPTISAGLMSGLVEELYRRSGLGGRDVPEEQKAHELEAISAVLGRSDLALNPRRIKRIFNRFIWFLCHQPPVDPDAIEDPERLDSWLTWLMATDYWRGLREVVTTHGESAFKELGNQTTGHPIFPHSSDAAKSALTALEGRRSLIEFLRGSIVLPVDPHTLESQEEMRRSIQRFAEIDDTLRRFGM